MTIVASWGGSDSNAYIGLTEANSFITTSVVNGTAWTSANSVLQQAALLEATRAIDAHNFLGGRFYFLQKLKFPRALFGEPYPWSNSNMDAAANNPEYVRMKEDVERACCLQAIHILRYDGRNEHIENRMNGIRSVRETTGPLSDSVDYFSAGDIRTLSSDVLALLSRWMEGRPVYRG